MHILVVEDERDLNRLIIKRLQAENYTVDTCYDGKTAYEYLHSRNYDMVILDLMLPIMSGKELLKTIRGEKNITPVIILSALDSNEDIVDGLDLGADDYLAKPFDFEVLLARIRAILRKKNGMHENIYRCGDLELRVSDMSVTRAGNPITLTPKEYTILEYMLRNQNVVLTREQMEADIWDLRSDMSSNVVDVYIRYLRRKIDDDYDVKLIHTIRGMGYRMSYEEE
ncbi:MAG TPA: DNA-binding response regulator [Lachnospiraceae bacterium]|nr:DNA-binding response regulator [Lachnospiraceae bacterium]